MKRKIKGITIILIMVGIIILFQYAGKSLKNHIAADMTAASPDSAPEMVVVLDPGHGGVDDGKIGVNGVKEKDINLKIVLEIKNILTKEGIAVVMTRESDERLGDTQTKDLKERVNIMNKIHPTLVVSIHQNSFRESEVRGPQVFYYTDSEEGKSAAKILQAGLNEIDPTCARDIKPNSSYYILKHAEVPAVIVECGFLSNVEEAAKLATGECQKQVATVISDGVIQYIGEFSD